MDREQLSEATVRRLPLYLRCLVQLEAEGLAVVSSERLAEMSGGNAAQVRKDLSQLGETGVRGIGYDVPALAAQMARRLGVDRGRRLAIVGYGRLGAALRGYPGFEARGFRIVAVLDSDPGKVGQASGDLTVRDARDLERVIRDEGVEIVLIATPAEAAASVAHRAVSAGVRAFLNMAPTVLDMPDGVVVRYVDLSVEMQVLSFKLGESDSDLPVAIADAAPAPAAVVAAAGPEAAAQPSERVPAPGEKTVRRVEDVVPVWLAVTVLVLLLGVVSLGAWLVRGIFVNDAGTSPAAIEIRQLEDRVDQDPRNMRALIELAFAYQEAARYQEALDAYDKVLEADPKETAALYNRGVIYLELNLDDKAEDALWDVLGVDATHALAASSLGEMYAEKGHYKSLVVAVRPAAEAHPEAADLQYLLGLAYEKTGHPAWAVERYRMALQRVPDMQRAREGLKRLGGSM